MNPDPNASLKGLTGDEKPSIERLHELFILDAQRGRLYRRVCRPGKPAGLRAGGHHPSGYRFVQIDGRRFGEHRVVWALATGAWQPDGLHIDHRNGICDDNRPENLRLATRFQNQANRRNQRDQTSPKGVRLHSCGKWEARIRVDGVPKYLGLFPSAGAAKGAYDAAQRAAMGEFARS